MQFFSPGGTGGMRRAFYLGALLPLFFAGAVHAQAPQKVTQLATQTGTFDDDASRIFLTLIWKAPGGALHAQTPYRIRWRLKTPLHQWSPLPRGADTAGVTTNNLLCGALGAPCLHANISYFAHAETNINAEKKLAPGHTYQLQIAARGVNGEMGEWSDSIEQITHGTAAPKPEAPGNVRAAVESENALTVTWDAPADVDAYRLRWRSVNADGEDAWQGWAAGAEDANAVITADSADGVGIRGTVTTYTIQNLPHGATYETAIAALRRGTLSDWSAAPRVVLVSADAALKTLEMYAGNFADTDKARLKNEPPHTLTPAFHPDVTAYTSEFLFAAGAAPVTMVTLIPATRHHGATLGAITGASGTPVPNVSVVPVAHGHTTIVIPVTAENGVDMKNYTIAITRYTPPEKMTAVRAGNHTNGRQISVFYHADFDPFISRSTPEPFRIRYRIESPLSTWQPDAQGLRVRYQSGFSCSNIVSAPVNAVCNVIQVPASGGITPGTAHALQVRAVNPYGAGPWSDAFAVTTGGGQPSPPQKPTSLTATPGGLTLALNWEAPAGSVTDYRVRWRISGDANAWQGWVSDAAKELSTGDNDDGINIESSEPGYTLSLAAGAYDAAVAAMHGGALGAWSDAVTATVLPPSDNAQLANLTFSAGAFESGFDSGVFSYHARVGESVASVTIGAQTADANAMLAVHPPAVNGMHALTAGRNEFSIAVTAQNTTAMRTYMLSVDRSSGKLARIAFAPGMLAPDFHADTFRYNINVTHATTTATFSAHPVDSAAQLQVNAESVDHGEDIASALQVGENIFRIAVTADGASARTYALHITRAGGTALAQLEISDGVSSPLLAPTFDAATLTYTAQVRNAATAVTLSARAQNDAAVVTVGGNATDAQNMSMPQQLIVGENAVDIAVTAEDGAVRNYRVLITRAAPFAMNVDASAGGVTAQDGIMIARFLLGVRGEFLTAAQTTDPHEQVTARIESGVINDALDIDGDGSTGGNDGILIARYLLGLRGDALIKNISTATAGSRVIAGRIESLLP